MTTIHAILVNNVLPTIIVFTIAVAICCYACVSRVAFAVLQEIYQAHAEIFSRLCKKTLQLRDLCAPNVKF
jgi:capsular polysaccharide biosynthesis protein